MERKNINRGFKQLRVWEDSVILYTISYEIFSRFPFELKKVASNSIDAAHSISRNIAEGYCHRSLNEGIDQIGLHSGSTGILPVPLNPRAGSPCHQAKYCKVKYLKFDRCLNEYLKHLNIALGSCGEFHSCYESFLKAGQISKEEYEELDKLHYKVENSLLKLIESLQKKQQNGDWEENLYKEESY
jgi:hypothetical protein